MASTTWRIQGIDTGGQDLVLSQIQPWSTSGAVVPLTITSTFPPVSGSLDDLLIADSTACVFAAADVQKPGFDIEFTFAGPEALSGFRFAGPSPTTWPLMHSVFAGTTGQTLASVVFVAPHVLSPVPQLPLREGMPIGEVYAFSGVRSHRGVSLSRDGLTVAVAHTTGVVVSLDGGTTWPSGTTLTNTVGAAVSGDGTHVIVVSQTAGALLSTDSGSTWSPVPPIASVAMLGVAMSETGETVVVVRSGAAHISHDFGATWSATSGFSGVFNTVAVSDDGQVILLGPNGNVPRLSKDGGATWSAARGSAAYEGAAVSGDGQTLLLGIGSTGYSISTNGGTTWVGNSAVVAHSCGASEDGSVLALGGNSGAFSVSTDGGATWVSKSTTLSANITKLAISGDGACVAAHPTTSSTNVYGYRMPDSTYVSPPFRTPGATPTLVIQGLPPDPQGTLNTYAAEAVQFNDLEFSGNGRVYGTVERKNTPANVPLRRRVRLHRSRDGMLVRETWSKPDGSYEFKHISMHYEYDAIAWDHEMSYRSVIANNLKPEAM